MMFVWPTRSMRRRAPKTVNRTQLTLELLEARDCPDATQPGPQLTISAALLSGQTVQVTGTVADSDPTTVSIALSGVLSGTAQADADGNFSFIGQASSLGPIYAQATDAEQLTSGVAEADLSASTPSITLNPTYNQDGTVTLAGQVTDDSPGNLTVTLAGPVNAQVNTADDGTFSYTTGAWGPGDQQASVTDAWGQSANSAVVTLTPPAPSALTLSAAYNPDGSVTLAGQVTADFPAGLTVTLAGAVNTQLTTADDGSFSYTTTGWDLGDVDASATDSWGQSSPSADVTLSAAAPVVTLNGAINPDGTVTLAGQVTAPLPANLTVTLTGVVNADVTTAQDGSFSYTTTAANLGDVEASTADSWGQSSNTAQVTLSADPPALTLSAGYNADGSVTLSGQVADVAPGNLTVTLTGGVNAQVTTAADGTFSYTTTGWGRGDVEASTADSWGQSSNTAQVTLSEDPPTLTLNAGYNADGSVTLSGQVADVAPGNLTVTLAGGVNAQVTTAADGTFSYTTTGWGLGDVEASTTDSWGQSSNTAQVTLSADPPALTLSAGYNADGSVTLSGQVADVAPGNLTVTLAGGVNAQVTTAADGTFSYTTTGWGLGDVEASTTDSWGQSSNTAQVTLSAAPPALTLNAGYNADGSVTLSGQVADVAPGNLTVTLAGGVNAQVTTAADGTFSYTTTGWGLGDVEASTTDSWGQGSNTAEVTLSAAAPTVTLNGAINPDGTVTLAGQVTAPLPANLTVTLTGVVNAEVTTAQDGSFNYTTTAADLGDVEASTTDSWGQSSNTAQVTLSEDPPTLTLSAGYNADRSVTLSGQVADVAPGNLTVTLTGGVNAQVTTAADGSFSYTTTAYMFGTVQASVTDLWGQESAPAQATLTPAAPVLSLNVAYGPNGSVTLSGQVTANDPGNLTVTLTGMVNAQVTTAADGTFSYTTTSWGLGNVQASTTDSWGQSSNTAQVTLANSPPVITGFNASENPNNMWTFEGQVSDEWAPGLSVRLGGVPSLQGVMVEVGSDGWFSTTVQLQPGEAGTATAMVTDWWGVTSQVVYALVSPTN